MPRIALDMFSVEAPPGWEDVTDSFDADDPPTTLARGDGIGALRFSVALYAEGSVPNPSPEDLSHMINSFAEARNLGTPSEIAIETTPLRLAAGSFMWGEDFLRVWQVSDDRNFALITCTCESGQEGRELSECERIVRSLHLS